MFTLPSVAILMLAKETTEKEERVRKVDWGEVGKRGKSLVRFTGKEFKRN